MMAPLFCFLWPISCHTLSEDKFLLCNQQKFIIRMAIAHLHVFLRHNMAGMSNR